METASLIFWHRRVDLVRPIEDPPLEVLHLLEPLLPEERRRPRAPCTHLAVHDDLLVSRKLLVAARNLAQRNQRRSGNPANLILGRLADIEQEEIFLRIHLAFEIANIGL